MHPLGARQWPLHLVGMRNSQSAPIKALVRSLTLDDPDGDEEAKVGVGGDGGEEGEDGRHQDPQSQHPLPPVQLGQPAPGVLEVVQGCQLSIF